MNKEKYTTYTLDDIMKMSTEEIIKLKEENDKAKLNGEIKKIIVTETERKYISKNNRTYTQRAKDTWTKNLQQRRCEFCKESVHKDFMGTHKEKYCDGNYYSDDDF